MPPRNKVGCITLLAIPAIAIVVVLLWIIDTLTTPVIASTDYPGMIIQLQVEAQSVGENGRDSLERSFHLGDLLTSRALNRYPDSRLGSDGTRWDSIDTTLLYPSREMSEESIPGNLEPEQWLIEQLEQSDMQLIIDQALASESFVFEPPRGQQLINWMLPFLSPARSLSRLLVAQAWIQIEQGRQDDALDTLERAIGIGRAISWHPTLVGRLSGIAIETLVLQQASDLLEMKVLDQEGLRRLENMVIETDEIPGIEYHLESERLYLLDIIQWNYTDDGSGNGWLVGSAVGGMPVSPWGGNFGLGILDSLFGRLTLPDRKTTTMQVNDIFDITIAGAKRPIDQQLDDPDPELDYIAKMTPNPVISMLLIQRARMFQIESRFACLKAGLALAIEAEIHRLEHGDYPDSIDDLDLSSEAWGGIDPFVMEQMRYERIGDAIRIVHAGLDRRFDGVQLTKNKQAFQTGGSDWVIYGEPLPSGSDD